MDPVLVAFLVLAALFVGMAVPVMLQLWLTLRQVRQELRTVRARVDPLLDEIRTVVTQARGVTTIASAVGAAVTAGVRAWRETRADVQHNETGDVPQESPRMETAQ